jgi:hypothetical protein
VAGAQVKLNFPQSIDDRDYLYMDDASSVSMDVLTVVLRGNYQATFTDAEIETHMRSQSRGMHLLGTVTRKQLSIAGDRVVVDRHFDRDAFIGFGELANGKPVVHFAAWDLLARELKARGVDIQAYDILQVLYPRSGTAPEQISGGGGFAAPARLFGYGGPRLTAFYGNFSPEAFAHEVGHHMIWYLWSQGVSVRDMDPHDTWWQTAYPADPATRLDPHFTNDAVRWLLPVFVSLRHKWGLLVSHPEPIGIASETVGANISEVRCVDDQTYTDTKRHCPNGTQCGWDSTHTFYGCRCTP